MTQLQTQRCEHCNRSGLSLLLLRPSPVALDARIAPVGSSRIKSAGGLVSGLLPVQPLQSRTALRLLRAGFVHVYIPAPPPGVSQWLHYRVSDNADLHRAGTPAYTAAQPQVCAAQGHNALGMRLLPIPQAHLINEIWIAYSANHWTEEIKSMNAANPAAMQKISLRACGPNELQAPTGAQLKEQVLEFALANHVTADFRRPEFAFVGLVGQEQAMAEQLRVAASLHPATKGLERAVVLRDPVGYAAELNSIRVLRHEMYLRELERKENAHPLNSSSAVLGIKSVIVDSNKAQSAVRVSPLKTKAKFESEQWPPGTEWQPLSDADRAALMASAQSPLLDVLGGQGAVMRHLFQQPDMGRVLYPDHEARARKWADEAAAETWSKLSPHIDEAARASWVKAFTARMQREHLDPLALLEDDWRDAVESEAVRKYFLFHWDEGDPNPKLRAAISAGVAYARENQYINVPAPFTEGKVLDRYLAELQKDITDQSAITLRAVVANQKALIDLVHEQITGDPGDTGMRDKTYDFLKGVLGLDAGKTVQAKFNWMGDALAMFSVGQLCAFSTAVSSAAIKSKTANPFLVKAMGRVQFLWGVQQALDMAVAASLSGRTGKMPVLVTKAVPIADALEILRARPGEALGVSRSRVKRMRGQQATIRLSFLTDTEALRAVAGDVDALLRQAGNGAVRMGSAGSAAAQAGAAGRAATLSESQFLRLFARGAGQAGDPRAAVRQALAHAGADIRNITMTLDGRLALGSIVAQGIGLYNGLAALKNAKDQAQVRDAWYGIYDSSAGVLGGLLETWAVAVNLRLTHQFGTQAAARSVSLGTLRAIGFLAGAAGGFVNAVGAWAKAGDAKAAGNDAAFRAYAASSAAFFLVGGAGVAAAVGAGADTMVARGVGGALARSIATRVGAQGAIAVVGGTAITVSGIGLVLLGAGVAFQVGAMALTPTAMQRWLSRSYFGRDPSFWDWDGEREDMFAKGDWKAELEGLQQALDEGRGS